MDVEQQFISLTRSLGSLSNAYAAEMARHGRRDWPPPTAAANMTCTLRGIAHRCKDSGLGDIHEADLETIGMAAMLNEAAHSLEQLAEGKAAEKIAAEPQKSRDGSVDWRGEGWVWRYRRSSSGIPENGSIGGPGHDRSVSCQTGGKWGEGGSCNGRWHTFASYRGWRSRPCSRLNEVEGRGVGGMISILRAGTTPWPYKRERPASYRPMALGATPASPGGGGARAGPMTR